MLVTTASRLVEEARAQITNLTVDEVAGRLRAGLVTLVDLREADEIRHSGSVSGAIHAPRGMLEFYADTTSPYHLGALDPSAHLILYCASGARSALACQTLRQLGYEHIAHLDGGFKAWKASGMPVAPPRR